MGFPTAPRGIEGLESKADVERFVQELLDRQPKFYPPGLLPVGGIAPFGGATAPRGWLLCDGAAISRTAYPELFTTLGTTYGVGDGSTTFNLPDLRGRAPVGEDGAAARLTASDTLGASAGAEKHTLVAGEMPSHTHKWLTNNAAINDGSDIAQRSTVTGSAQSTTPTSSAGSDQAHNNMQPYQVVNFIVRAA